MTMESEIDAAVETLVQAICGVSTDGYFREAATKYAIRALSWLLVSERVGVSKYDLAEHLKGMGDVIEESANEDPPEGEPEPEVEPMPVA